MLQALILGSILYGWNAHLCGHALPINLTVAKDGSGDFRTINEALKATPNNSETRFYLKIKSGIYRETVAIGKEKKKLTLIGDGMLNTIIIGNKSNRSGFRTYDTATAGIKGQLFAAIDITFQNDAGPQNMQAVALRSEVDSAFYRCQFLGYQDTLLAMRGNQFYRECHIYGTVDIIWGNAQVIFQKSIIFVRTPLKTQHITITAQGRDEPKGNQGTVLHDCYINGTKDFNHTMFRTYLGRPWRIFSRVVIMKTYINDLIDPEGWERWDSNTQTDKVFYGEYANRGLGAAISQRANWTGVKIMNSYKEASLFSVRNFINGDQWIPPMGIPFNPDL